MPRPAEVMDARVCFFVVPIEGQLSRGERRLGVRGRCRGVAFRDAQFEVATVEVGAGTHTHTLESSSPFGLLQLGYASTAAYAHPGGILFDTSL